MLKTYCEIGQNKLSLKLNYPHFSSTEILLVIRLAHYSSKPLCSMFLVFRSQSNRNIIRAILSHVLLIRFELRLQPTHNFTRLYSFILSRLRAEVFGYDPRGLDYLDSFRSYDIHVSRHRVADGEKRNERGARGGPEETPLRRRHAARYVERVVVVRGKPDGVVIQTIRVARNFL